MHQEVLRQGFTVSLSSVERTLERKGLVRKRSPWKRWHFTLPRPEAAKPGFLVQIDTIHVAPRRSLVFPKFYVYTLLDVFSRWAFARVSARINTHRSLSFLKEAQRQAPFPFAMLQSDHGSEFSSWFTEQVKVEHRHSRVRQPNDNGHLERFNRTIQEECLNKVRLNPRSYQEAIDEYLPYYNNERMHLSLNFKTPSECFQASD
ncbi:MAG: transposase [Candidatus Wildermuthbacteria bacterium]|nr:transposase [Candidatus Wildermuthbacteria bacterium]